MRPRSFGVGALLLWALTSPAVAGAPSGASPAAWPPARRHAVEIRGFRFVPDTVAAAPGDTVVWINRDVVPHTATADDGTWDSGRIEAGGSWTLVVPADGTGGYLCELHPGMRGVVTER